MLWSQLDEEIATRRVTFEWVRGHADDPLNARADELAHWAAEKIARGDTSQRKPPDNRRSLERAVSPIVKIRRVRKSNVPLPRYQSAHAAGMDLVADIPEPLALKPMERAAVPTGVAIQVPPDFEGQVRPRSGRAINEGLTLVNAPGTIDADYRGEIKVLLVNLGNAEISIRPGERIAQLVIAPIAHAEFVEVEQLDESPRGEGGFGHTGR